MKLAASIEIHMLQAKLSSAMVFTALIHIVYSITFPKVSPSSFNPNQVSITAQYVMDYIRFPEVRYCRTLPKYQNVKLSSKMLSAKVCCL